MRDRQPQTVPDLYFFRHFIIMNEEQFSDFILVEVSPV